MEKLGDVLKRRRDQLGLSLRDVEEKAQVSNAYLSQVENHKITQPSPTVLSKLSETYDLSFQRLMSLAGHPLDIKNDDKIFFKISRGLEEITADEEKELLRYLRFIRNKDVKR
ncbi:MAG: helix-turn-helix transcriptional regulator [Candidatus Nitrosotenuis sp.]